MLKIFLLIAALSGAAILQAQNSTPFNFTFNHVALCVKDVDRSADFYKKVLQLQEITNRTKKDGIRWFSLGEGKELHLNSTLKQPFSVNKSVHTALTTPNFDAFVKRLEMLGIAYSDWPGAVKTVTTRADGIKQIYFQDPDGYWIELNNVVQ